MKNVDIIWSERMNLLREGKIPSTGRKIEVPLENGGVHVVEEPIAIHTFQAWKVKGFKVKRGEKAIAKFPIWKYGEVKSEAEDGEEKTSGKMFMKNSCFFSAEQVEPMLKKRD